jgi:hypothetical protein
MKRIGSVLAGLVLAAGVTLVAADPAAASGFGDCPFGTGCTWSGPGATGTINVFSFSRAGAANHCIPNLGLSVQSATATYGGSVKGLAIFHGTGCNPNFGKFIANNNPQTFATFNMGSWELIA